MKVIRVSIKIKPEEETKFIKHMTKFIEEVKQKFDGNDWFGLYKNQSEDNSFLIYQEWTEKGFTNYQESEFFSKSRSDLIAMMIEPPNSSYFDAEVTGHG